MNDTSSTGMEAICEALRRYRRFAVVTHEHPDGDAVGSVLAMTTLLDRLGKEADPYCQDPFPPGHDFLPGTSRVRRGTDDPGRYEAVVLVDCGEFSRVGPPLAEAFAHVPVVINIDHHVSRRPFGTFSWVEETASSTCEMLYELGLGLGIKLDETLASQLYMGLMTDTGGFRFSNTNQKVLEIAARLVAAGADPARIAAEVYESVSPQGLRLLAEVLNTVEFHAGERLAAAELTRSMLEKTGGTRSDSEGFINHLRAVKPVQIAILFKEEENGLIHVSLRSKGNADVASFAQSHGGGGHRRAAAFRTNGSMDAVRARIVREALGCLTDD